MKARIYIHPYGTMSYATAKQFYATILWHEGSDKERIGHEVSFPERGTIDEAKADAGGYCISHGLEPEYIWPNDIAIRALIVDDAFATSFQSMGQYRTALLKAIDNQEASDEQ